MNTKLSTLITTSMLLLSGAASASTQYVLDFETDGIGNAILNGQIIDIEYALAPPPGTGIAAVNVSSGPDKAVIYDTDLNGQDPDLRAPFVNVNNTVIGGQLLSDNYFPGNVLIIQETNNCNANFCTPPDDEGSRPAGFFEFVFDEAVTLVSIDFFDVENAEGAVTSNNEIRFFDALNAQIGVTRYTPTTGGDRSWDRVAYNVEGVRRMVIELNGSGAIDNVVYRYQPIPLPAAVWLLGSALGGLATVARRRR